MAWYSCLNLDLYVPGRRSYYCQSVDSFLPKIGEIIPNLPNTPAKKPARGKSGLVGGIIVASVAVGYCIWTGVRRPRTDRPLRENVLPKDAPDPPPLPEATEEPLPSAPPISREAVEPWPELSLSFLNGERPRRRFSAFTGSLLIHCAVSAAAAMLSLSQDVREPNRHRLTYQILELRPPVRPIYDPPVDPAPAADAKAGKALARPNPADAGKSPVNQDENGSERRAFEVLAASVARKAQHTLVQLDLPAQSRPADHVQVPETLVWAEKKNVSGVIQPGPASRTVFPDTVPVINLPAPEIPRTDIALFSEPALAIPPLAAPRATASPARMPAQDAMSRVPQIESKTSNEASAGQLISVSEIPLPPEGRIVVPAVSQVATRGNTEATGPQSTRGGTAGADQVNVAAAVPGATVPNEGIVRQPSPGGWDASAGARPAGIVGSLRNGMTLVSHSPTGRHSAVVLGAQAADAYPESAGVLSGKAVYTVYLQVGLRKSWILQFCAAASGDPARSVTGGFEALDAPYPFTIVRPPLDTLSGDYTLVHGRVSTAGRLEQLALVTPDEAGKKDLVDALSLWEFRPASRRDQAIPVEVLLIIPHRRE